MNESPLRQDKPARARLFEFPATGSHCRRTYVQDHLEAPISRVRSTLPMSTYVQVYEPRVGDFDVRLFLSLTQADAYNPLIVGTSMFALPSEDVASAVSLPPL